MNNSTPDEEDLAAFLDGTLSPSERARVARMLDEQPELRASVVEAMRIADAAQAPANDAPGIARARSTALPIARPRRRTPLRLIVPVLAAAGLAVVAVRNRPVTRDDALALLQQMPVAGISGDGSLDSAFGGGWDTPGWSVSRGDAVSRATVGTAVRVGVRVAQLEAAASAKDRTATRRISAHLLTQLEAIDGAAPVALRLRVIDSQTAAERATFERQVRDVMPAPRPFDFGVLLYRNRYDVSGTHLANTASSAQARAMLQSVAADAERGPEAASLRDVILHARRIDDLPSTAVPAIRSHLDSALSAIPR